MNIQRHTLQDGTVSRPGGKVVEEGEAKRQCSLYKRELGIVHW